MKTILHLIETSGPGGAEKMLISLVENLEPGQYRSIICLLKEGWLSAQLQQRGFTTLILPQRQGLDLHWLRQCVRLIRQHRVDLLHAHEFTMNTFGSLAAWLCRVPIVTTVHGKRYYADKWQRRLAYRFVARHAASMVAVSEDIKRFLTERVRVRTERLATVYNGIDTKAYAPSEDGIRIREELEIARTALVIGTVGNLYAVKGHTYLLKAAARVVRILPEAVFLIIGRGALLDLLQDEARALGIDTHVRFLGFREDIPALLHSMDLFVLSSLSEGHPLSLLEAMASCKPVVATHVGGIPEVVQHGQTGILVPPGDPERLASEIIGLLLDPQRVQQLGAEGRRRVYETFSLSQMVQRYQQLYEHAMPMS
jgi:sugar transferase (PEP-CTERM/EpsH1 system associated)